MHKRNPSLASKPNASIDLTSLLDVIFIFLFMVLIGTTVVYNERVKDLADKEEVVQQLIDEQNDVESKGYALEERLKYYEKGILGTKTRVVTICCKYSEADHSRRVIEIILPEQDEIESIAFDDSGQKDAFNKLYSLLSAYVAEKSNFDIVICINEEDILNKDYEAIDRRIHELAESNTNVYR